MKTEGLVTVISGAASGLGEATARRLLAEGAAGVVLIDVDETRGQALEAELGDRAVFVKCDITDEAAVNDAVALGEGRFGPIGALVAAAGIAGPAKLIGRNGPIEMAKFDAVMKVNVYGIVHLMRACVPSMQRNPGNEDGERGVIINVSSGAAYEGQIGQVAYSASKAAVVGMTMPLTRELAPSGIRVVTVAPGAFETPIYEQMPAATKEALIDSFLFPKRMGRADEFASFASEIIRNPIHNGRTYRFDAGNILPSQ